MILNNLLIRYEKTLKIPKTMENYNFKGKNCDKITSIREQLNNVMQASNQ